MMKCLQEIPLYCLGKQGNMVFLLCFKRNVVELIFPL